MNDLEPFGRQNVGNASRGAASITGSLTRQQGGATASNQGSRAVTRKEGREPSLRREASGHPIRCNAVLNPNAEEWYPSSATTTSQPHTTGYISAPPATAGEHLPVYRPFQSPAGVSPSFVASGYEQAFYGYTDAAVPMQVVHHGIMHLHQEVLPVRPFVLAPGNANIQAMQAQCMEQAARFLYHSVIHHDLQFHSPFPHNMAPGHGNMHGMQGQIIEQVSMNQFVQYHPHVLVPSQHYGHWTQRSNFVQRQRYLPVHFPVYFLGMIPAYAVYPRI